VTTIEVSHEKALEDFRIQNDEIVRLREALKEIRTTEDLEEICAIARDALKGGET